MQKSSRGLVRDSKRLVCGNTDWARRHRNALAPELGNYRNPASPIRAILSKCSWSKLAATLSDYIDSYVPRGVDAKTWERIGPFVRDSITLAAPKTKYTAEVLIGRASAYVAWCAKKGWPIDAETVWSLHSINLYLADTRLQLKTDTRRNYRAWLTTIARVLLPEENGEALATIRTRDIAAKPYTSKDMAGFRRWAAAQRDPLKRYRAMLMLVMCAGAGLRPVDFENLSAEHVETLVGGGYVIHVPGRDSRSIPLLAEWDEWLEVLLTRVPSEFDTLWGPPSKARKYSSLSAFTQTTTGTPPASSRLRETWALTLLASVANIKTVFRAAGVEKFDKLPQFLHHIDDVSDAEYIRFLRQEDQP